MSEDLKARMDAMSKRMDYLQDQNDDLRGENERLRDRIMELEKVVDPDPGSKDYQSMSRPEKVRKLRASLYRKADSNGGRSQMTYDEVLALFDHHPSAAHSYQLMERAAYAEGFRYDRMGPNNDGQKRLAVRTASVNDEQNFYTKNKAESSQATV